MRYEKDKKRSYALSYLAELGVLIPFDENVNFCNDQGEQIVSLDNGNYVFNMDYESEFFSNMVSALLLDLSNFSLTQLVPVAFEEREIFSNVFAVLKSESGNSNAGFITHEMCEKVYGKLSRKTNKEFVEKIAGSMNARLMLVYAPKTIIENYVTKRQDDSTFKLIDGNDELSMPMNYDFIASWLYTNNIVAVKGLKNQKDRQLGDIFVLDKTKVGTIYELKQKYELMDKNYHEITSLLKGFVDDDQIKEFLKTATPEEMLDFGKEIGGKYRSLLEGDSGNWEGYSVGEHTEAVIRNFEDAFSNNVPEELYPFMKFMMLTHDLGKSKGRYAQKTENAKACKAMCQDLSVDPKIEEIIQFIIGDSQSHTTNYFVMKDANAIKLLRDDCANVLMNVTGKVPSENMVNGLVNICKILQTCDSGSYTAYGVIRDEKTDVYYRGGNYSWTRGFKKPTDPRQKADMRFIEPVESV